MSLAAVKIAPGTVDEIHRHMTTHMPKYRNMHLRQNRTVNKELELRYLHAMRVKPGNAKVIEGMISGPEVFWHYELSRTQINVFVDLATPVERKRIGLQFETEILRRIRSEQDMRELIEESGGELPYGPKRSAGRLYLRRSDPPMSPAHPNCVHAVEEGLLDEDFLSEILPWGFELLCP